MEPTDIAPVCQAPVRQALVRHRCQLFHQRILKYEQVFTQPSDILFQVADLQLILQQAEEASGLGHAAGETNSGATTATQATKSTA